MICVGRYKMIFFFLSPLGLADERDKPETTKIKTREALKRKQIKSKVINQPLNRSVTSENVGDTIF